MDNELDEVFFDEFEGVETRFRNRDFYLSQEDIKVVEDFISLVVMTAKEKGGIDTKNFKKLMNVVEVLSRSPEEDASLLLERIYLKIDQIDLK